MKLLMLLAFLVATLTYGCSLHYAHDPDDYGRYGYEQPHSYYYDSLHNPYLDPHNYYPNGYRYTHGG